MADDRGLIGREREFAALREVLAGQQHPAAFVIGEAGIGKSRLIEEAGRVVGDDGVLVLRGTCLPLSQGLPLLPIVDVVRDCAGVAGGALLETALTSCRDFVRDSIERLLSASPPRLDDSADAALWYRQQTFEAVRQVVAAAAAQRRLALVIEDIHWADAMSVDMLEYLLAPGHGCGVPIVASVRDHSSVDPGAAATGLLERSARYPDAIRLVLGPMSVDEVSAQIAALTGESTDPGFAAAIYARSQGNPFFTEQLVAHLCNLDEETDVEAPMPAGLAELLLSRVAGIGGPAAEIIAVLAVAARPMEESQLSAVCGLDPDSVRAGLRTLSARGLLRPRDARYQLRHVLVEQAVSADLLPSHRRELHARLGSMISAQAGGQFEAEAAEHFNRAELAEQELRARTKAADHAQSVFAWSDAARHWRRALELYGPQIPRPDDRELAWTIYAGLHLALRALGETDAVVELAEESSARLLPYSDALQQAHLYRRLGEMRGITSPQAGLDLLEKCLEVCEGLDASVERLEALRDIEGLLRHSGRYSDAERALDEAILLAEHSGQRDARPDLIGLRAWNRMRVGDDDGAVALLAQMKRLVTDSASPRTPVVAATIATDVLLKIGRLDAVPAAAAAALEIANSRGLGDDFHTWILRSNVVEALTESGLVNAAAEVVGDVEHRALSWGAQWGHIAAAQLAMLAGGLDTAAHRWEALERYEIGSINLRNETAQLRAELDLWLSHPQAAFDRSITVIDEARDTDESGYCGHLLILAARACADLADTARARRDATRVGEVLAQSALLVELHRALKIDPLQPGPMRVTADAVRATWEAELARADGRHSPDTWAGAAAAWMAMRRPHRAAYAMLRQVEDLLSAQGGIGEARDVLPQAADLAREHVPLHRAIVELARRARITLTLPDPVAVRGEPERRDPFELTEREFTVLELIAAGKSNAEIGRQLYISPRTASVHVSNILRKLGVATRAHAAAVAQKSGIID